MYMYTSSLTNDANRAWFISAGNSISCTQQFSSFSFLFSLIDQ
jgi:hypothetical protein